MIYEYSFTKDVYGTIIVQAEDKESARELIDPICVHNEIERPNSVDDINECDLSDGIVFIKTGDYEE